jgi:hypothetical protein
MPLQELIVAQRDIKIKHIWTVLCQHSIIDAESHNISLIDVIEQLIISAPAPSEQQPTGQVRVGTVPIPFEVVSLWSRAEGTQPALGQCRVTFISPSGPLGEAHYIPVDLRKYERMRTRQRFGGIPVSEAGQYLFRIEYRDDGETEWREVDAVPLKVIIESGPERKP